MKSKSRDLLFQFKKKVFWTRLARIATFLHVLVVCHKHMCLSYNITRQIFLRAILFSTNCSKRIQQFTTLLKNVLLLCQCQGSKVTIFSFPHFRLPVFFLPYDLILGLYLVIIHTFFHLQQITVHQIHRQNSKGGILILRRQDFGFF